MYLILTTVPSKHTESNFLLTPVPTGQQWACRSITSTAIVRRKQKRCWVDSAWLATKVHKEWSTVPAEGKPVLCVAKGAENWTGSPSVCCVKANLCYLLSHPRRYVGGLTRKKNGATQHWTQSKGTKKGPTLSPTGVRRRSQSTWKWTEVCTLINVSAH